MIQDQSVDSVTIVADGDSDPTIRVEAGNVRAFYRAVAAVAAREKITLYEVAALDDSLTSVFAYVVGR